MRDQRRADTFAAPGDDVDDPLGEQFRQQLGELQGGQRRLLRGFQNHRVAGRKSRAQFPRGHHQRIVPGSDRGDDADRIAPDQAGEARQVLARQRAVLRARGAREEAKHVRNRGYLVVQRRGERLAGVVRFQLRECGGVGFDAIGQTQQQRGPILGYGLRPSWAGRLGCAHRGVQLCAARLGHFGNALAGRRVEHPLHRSFTANQRTIDQELRLHLKSPVGLLHSGLQFSRPPNASSFRGHRTAACAPSPAP